MIRFTCTECGERVRVNDSFAGKRGRCPFCKDIVSIPVESEPETEAERAGADDLAAALAGAGTVDEEPEAEPEGPAPPPPHAAEDLGEQADAELELPQIDPRSKTMELASLTAEQEDTYALSDEEPSGDELPERPAVPVVAPSEGAAKAAPSGRRSRRTGPPP